MGSGRPRRHLGCLPRFAIRTGALLRPSTSAPCGELSEDRPGCRLMRQVQLRLANANHKTDAAMK